jgi:hypothetical protein
MLMAAARRLVLLLVGLVVLGLPGGALAAEGGCPNEALRAELGSGFLPDCRAYEMVTPVFKEGYEFFPLYFSSDGDRVFLGSFAAVAGAEGTTAESVTETDLYLDTRTAKGWQLEPVDAPSSEFIQEFLAGEPVSGGSLWEQHTLAQSDSTHDLYVRSAGGVYSFVGPLATPKNSVGEPSNVMLSASLHAQVRAATSDYGHVVISAEEGSSAAAKYWPFDETMGNGGSIYEYSGTGNEQPILVGVRGERHSNDLLGKCGTGLGSRYLGGSVYNALSGDGETIFFTVFPCGGGPAVSEVWARRHGSLRSSLPAESVDVSARAPEPACTGACRFSPESDKEFEGASEDGERVFFTSTQQLLDGASQDPVASDNATEGKGCSVTTGVGGCNLYEYDLDGAAGGNLRLVAGGAEVLGVARIAENGSRIYFVAKGVLTTAGNEFGASAVAGQPNLYVYDAEEAERDSGYKPVFIATLSGSGDAEDWSNTDKRPVQATADGRFLLFVSSQPGLTPDDTVAVSQLFEYDAQTGELVRVSQGEDGYNDNGNGVQVGLGAPNFYITDFHPSANILNVAEDGMTVAFETTGRLSALATAAEQGCRSVYEYRSSGSISNGGVHLISDGVDVQAHKTVGCGVELDDMDASGANILFGTDDPLSAGDTDGVQRDVYDARVGGGFPLPSTVAGCEGDACLGAPAASPVLAGPGSTGVSGGGNLAPVVSPRVVKPRVKSLTPTQKLANALRACRRRPKRGRGVCEARARKRYGSAVRVSRANGRGK